MGYNETWDSEGNLISSIEVPDPEPSEAEQIKADLEELEASITEGLSCVEDEASRAVLESLSSYAKKLEKLILIGT